MWFDPNSAFVFPWLCRSGLVQADLYSLALYEGRSVKNCKIILSVEMSYVLDKRAIITDGLYCCLQRKSTNFDARHNISCILDKSLPRMEPFKDVIDFIDRSRIKKALTDKHKCYRSHIERFWNNARYDEDSKAIVYALKIKDKNQKDVDIEVKFKIEDVRRVLLFQDDYKDPIHVQERLVKGLWMRMGYTGYANETSYNKSKLSRPYKFLIHSSTHALHHRKGAFDVSLDFVMCVLTCLILNCPFNISQAIFNHMVDNIHGEKFLQYLRFIQMILDDQVKNLPKVDVDELKLDHMDSETLKRLDVYQGVKKDNEPPSRKQFASILKPDYAAPTHDKWRHDDNSDSEDKKMEPFSNKCGKFWLKAEDKKRKRDITPKASKPTTPKPAPKRASKKKSSPHLVDELVVPPENVTGEDLLNMTFAEYEKLSAAQVAQDAAKAAQEAEKAMNVEATTGGDTVKEVLVEGVVHTYSSETANDIDVTQIAPTMYVSGKFKIKGPSRKKKGSDEEDVPYMPTAAEAEKVKRGRGIKRSAKPSGATPRKQKVRKIVVKTVKDKAGESSKVLEKVTIEVPVVEAQVHVPSPPRSSIQESNLVQVEVLSTPPQQTKHVEERGSTTKKATTPIP
ncbi:hypothetical protein HanIR_Chr14g0675321 [Helianthus annuus]|nr:hypothetical protein HanIR_Chr14g0675321 [Helianthus annuus]KAJ0654853.1 hypothetical protein HanLR1_Chr14g0511851 [Helianthus annuus]